jgi:uncharacterized protein (TIGR03067 family)
MRRVQVLAVLVVAFLVAADDPKKEIEKLQGTWKLVSLEVDGKKATKGDIKKEQKMVVEGDKFSSTVDDKHSFKGTFKLDASKKPKAVDAVVTEGEYKGKTLLGIYEVEGDTMRACYAPPGKERPTEFVSKEGSGTYLYAYKREKP